MSVQVDEKVLFSARTPTYWVQVAVACLWPFLLVGAALIIGRQGSDLILWAGILVELLAVALFFRVAATQTRVRGDSLYRHGPRQTRVIPMQGIASIEVKRDNLLGLFSLIILVTCEGRRISSGLVKPSWGRSGDDLRSLALQLRLLVRATQK